MNKTFHLFFEGLIKYRLWLYLLYSNIVFNRTAYFDHWIYLMALLTSISVTIASYKFNTNKIRTLSDYALIVVGVYHSSLYTLSYLLILFPLIFSAIYRGKHYGYIDICFYTIIALSLNYFPHKIESNLLPPILIFFIISYIYANRRKWYDLEINLSQIIDQYFAKSQPDKPHHILQEILNGLNLFFKENFLLKKSSIEGIYVYSKTSNDKWFLRSGSQFWWKRDINDLDIINQDKLYNGKFIAINYGKQSRIFYCIIVDSYQYLFEIDIDSSMPTTIVFSLGFKRILVSIGIKFVHILSIDSRIKNYRNRKFTEVKDNIDYVNKAVNIMHFLRNRLTSITNLIVYDNLSEEKKTLPNAIYKKQCRQAKKDIEDIKTTAESLLDESHNPFKSSGSAAKVSLEKLFGILNEYSIYYLDLVVEIDNDEYPIGKYMINGDLLPYKMIIVDWLTNMSKYKLGYCNVSFSVSEESVVIIFRNDTFQKSNLHVVLNAINNNNIDTVLKKNTHGIASIKEYTRGLGITLSATIEPKNEIRNEIISLTMVIPIYGKN